jgi:GT2 family glycosyltransferase
MVVINSSFPLVYAVVLNWENAADSRLCLHALRQSGYPNLRIIVVDNGSQDDSAEKLRGEFPDIVFLLNETNLGFARGCNVGIREAMKDPNCAYLLLINNDAVIVEGTLNPALQFAEADPAVGAISGKVLSSPESKDIWYAGGQIDRWRGQARVRGFGEMDRGQYDSACEVGFVTGALMLIRRGALEVVGLLPEEYFFGVEEWDYSLLLQKAGYRLWYVPEFKSYHKADGSHWNYDPKFVYNSYRNKLIFQQKHLPSLIFALWKRAFSLYGKYLARGARKRLIAAQRFKGADAVQLDDLDFAFTSALRDHGRKALSARTLAEFEAELDSFKSHQKPQAITLLTS